MNRVEFNKELERKIKSVESALKEYMAPRFPEKLFEAMGYSLFAGGKRLRPVLLLSACEAVGGDEKDGLSFAAALEMIHTYSLIHDDLPAMDDDDFRRGRPTNHKVYGEANAILAGDGLLTYAFETMLSSQGKSERILKAARIIAEFSGSKGMLVGQFVDCESEGKKIEPKLLNYIHSNKTAGLIKAALCAGAVMGGADEDITNGFLSIGEDLGIAFQIMDDILDVTSSTEVLGKPVLSDEKNEKATYVSLFGLEKSKTEYENYFENINKGIDKLEEKNVNVAFLREYINILKDRKK